MRHRPYVRRPKDPTWRGGGGRGRRISAGGDRGNGVGVLVGFDTARARRGPKWSPVAAALARLVEPAAYALGHALRVARGKPCR